MMPALHNYVTVDTDGFLSNSARVLAAFEMAKAVRFYPLSLFSYFPPNLDESYKNLS